MKSETEFVKKVKRFIIKNSLLDKGDNVLVCLSGGADSVCLLRIMCALKDDFEFNLYASHVNHMLRADQADSDEQFCKDLCAKLGVELYTLCADVASIAKEKGESVEAAARSVRYDYFFSLKKELGIDKILTAHNKNDNAETSLMYYLRGSGIDGIKGIVPKRDDGVVRPLLCVLRKEIEEYLDAINQDFVTDKTNFEAVYMRNKLRLNLIPELEKNYNSNLIETLSDNALLMGIDAMYLNNEAQKRFEDIVEYKDEKISINIDEYNKTEKPLALRIIRYAIAMLRGSDKNISYDTIMRCDSLFCEGKTAQKVSIDKEYFALRDYKEVLFKKECAVLDSYCYKAELGRDIYIEEIDMSFHLSVTDKMERAKKNCEYFDYNLLCGQIYIRSRKNGDVFAPFNMKGTKKLKDFFIDEKITHNERESVPLLVCGDDVLWVCGMRRSNLYKVSAGTKSILKIELWEGK